MTPIKLLPYIELHLCQTNYHHCSSCCMAGDSQTDLPQYTKSDPNQIMALRHKDKNEAKPEINLPVGTHVMFTTPPNKKWYPAVIEEYLGY